MRLSPHAARVERWLGPESVAQLQAIMSWWTSTSPARAGSRSCRPTEQYPQFNNGEAVLVRLESAPASPVNVRGWATVREL
jgi:hypothetical protein